MVLLRGYGPGHKSESAAAVKSVIACMRDGVVACFFIAPDGTISMQVTTVASDTFEINSNGAVLMFSSELHLKKEEVEKPTGTIPTCMCFVHFFINARSEARLGIESQEFVLLQITVVSIDK